MKKIALEEHFCTPELAGYACGPAMSMQREGFARFEPRLLEVGAERIEAMDRAEIELAVLSVTTPGVQREPDTALAIARAQRANDYLATRIARHPRRFAGFAHLPLQDPLAAADELTRCVTELGFRGAMVNGHTNGRYLDERSFDPFWERAQALGVPVYLHPADPWDSPHMYQGHRELLGATWSWTVEAATHALRLVFGGTFTRFPALTVILGHMGETLPYLLWRLDSRTRVTGVENGAAPPSQIIRKNIVVTTTGVCAHPSLLCALAALGEDRVLFSVDYPYEDCSVAARFIETAPIGAAGLRKVCYANAERVLGLKLASERSAAA